MSRLRHVARNSALLMTMSLTIRLLGMVLVAAIGRRLLQEGFGQYTFILAFIFVAGAVMDMGISSRAVRTFARDKTHIPHVFLNSVIAKGFLTVVTFAACAVILNMVKDDKEVIHAGYAFLIGIALYSFSNYFRVHFDSIQRMEFQTFLEIGRQMIVVGGCLWTLHRGYGLVALGIVFSIAAAVQLVFWCILYLMFFPPPRWEIGFRQSVRIVKQALPFGSISLIAALFARMDCIVLNLIAGDVETGIFSGAMQLILVLVYLSTSFQNAAFPVFSTLNRVAGSEGVDVYQKIQKLFLCTSVPMAFGLSVLATPILDLLFEGRFASSAPLLVFLSWGIVLHYLAVCSNAALRGIDREVTSLRLMAAACAFNLVADIALVLFLGAKGAAIANFLTKVLWVILSHRALKRVLADIHVLPDLLRVLCAGAVMGVTIFFLRHHSIFILVPLGALVYGLALLATRVTSLHEAKAIIGTMRFKPASDDA